MAYRTLTAARSARRVDCCEAKQLDAHTESSAQAVCILASPHLLYYALYILSRYHLEPGIQDVKEVQAASQLD